MPPIDALGTEYLTLSLEIERLFPGFVDAYFGPAALRTRANSGDLPDPIALLDRARRLLTDVQISEYEANRKEFLRAQITGMITTCRKLAGEEIPYVDEVRDCFDIEVGAVPDAELDASLAELDSVLPGEGSVRERNIAYRQQFTIDQATAARLIDLTMTETRFRTQQFIDLPPGESVEIDLRLESAVERIQLVSRQCHVEGGDQHRSPDPCNQAAGVDRARGVSRASH